jgi:hypothetical protein
MKNRRIIRIFGIALILSLLLIALPVSPAFATTYSITLSPTQGEVGDTVTVHGTRSPASPQIYSANIYISPTNVDVGANLSTASFYYTRLRSGITILTTLDDPINAGNFTTTFTIPATIAASADPLAGGANAHTVASGTYYVYATITSSLTPTSYWIVAAKTTLTVTAPTLDPLSPTTGPAGSLVVVSGSNLPASTALIFKFDTTTLTPSGHTSTLPSGLFLSSITIPSGATAGAHTIYVTAGTGASAVTLSATFTVTAAATPAIDLSVVTGAPGTSVIITGSYFTVSTALVFQFDTTTLTPTSGDIATRSSGIFITIIAIPATATAGAHTITVTAGTTTDSATFTVTGTQTTTPPPTPSTVPLSLNQTSGAIGSTINIAGSGFLLSHAFTVTYSGSTANTTGTTQANGFFFASFQVPPSLHGIHIITATDGTHVASANFTVESTRPQTPQPLRPYMSEAVSSPITFDWADGEDVSLPITYKLQIATAATFAADTIIIDKTGITTSEYTLNVADELKVTTDVTYYWREKAVDAASNESDWTGANEFSIAKSFEFAGWLLYVTIAIGALFLFLLGIWIGRKTAYNY